MGQSDSVPTIQTGKKRKRVKYYGHWTIQGKVIYKRPKHYFTLNRCVNIINKIVEDFDNCDPIAYKRIVSILAGSIRMWGKIRYQWIIQPKDWNLFLDTQKLFDDGTKALELLKKQWKDSTINAVKTFLDVWGKAFPSFNVDTVLKEQNKIWPGLTKLQKMDIESIVNDWLMNKTHSIINDALLGFANFFYDLLFSTI